MWWDTPESSSNKGPQKQSRKATIVYPAISHKYSTVAGVILAGGENRRYPAIKGFIKIGESTIIERNLGLLKELFSEVLISTNTPELYFPLGVPLVGDVLPSKGPMSGIHSALLNIRGNAVLVTACDMPFLDPKVISLIGEEHAKASEAEMVDATIPICHGEPQPLFGIYSKTILPYLEEGVLHDKTAMKRFVREIATHFIEETVIRAVDPDGRSFININTPEDYERIARGAFP